MDIYSSELQTHCKTCPPGVVLPSPYTGEHSVNKRAAREGGDVDIWAVEALRDACSPSPPIGLAGCVASECGPVHPPGCGMNQYQYRGQFFLRLLQVRPKVAERWTSVDFWREIFADVVLPVSNQQCWWWVVWRSTRSLFRTPRPSARTRARFAAVREPDGRTFSFIHSQVWR